MQRSFSTIALCLSLSACIADSRADNEEAPSLPVHAVTQQVVSDELPSSYSGTVLVDGEYDLVASKLYVGRGGDAGALPRTPVAERLVIRGGKIKFFTMQNGATVSAQASLTFCGGGLSLSFTAGPSAGTQRVVGVNTDGDSLEIHDQRQARTYVLRTGTATGVEQLASAAACKQTAVARRT